MRIEARVQAFQETPLQDFWPAVVLAISVAEVFSVFSFQNPAGNEPWTIRTDHEAGDFGFDPIGLKPTDAAELKEMQTKELNNGIAPTLPRADLEQPRSFFPPPYDSTSLL